jgi:hypothetical protein
MAIDKTNLALVRQSFANTAFSHKVHEMAAERKGRIALYFKVQNIVLISAALALFILQTMNPTSPIFSYLGAGLTAGEIIAVIVQLSFGMEAAVVAHKNTALKYMSLRDRYKLLLADLLNDNGSSVVRVQKRDELLREYQTVSDLALQSSQKDYHKAFKRLKLKEDKQNVWSDKQIDSLLPKNLR